MKKKYMEKYMENPEQLDSDDELIIKYTKPNKSNGKFDSTGYAHALNNKISRLKIELTKTEEKCEYLQFNECNLKESIKDQRKLNEKLYIQSNIFKCVCFISLFVNGFFITNYLNREKIIQMI